MEVHLDVVNTLFDSLTDKILLINGAGEIIFFTDAAGKLGGVVKERDLGQSLARVDPHSPLLTVLKTGESQLIEENRGGQAILAKRLALFDSSGNVRGAIEILSDPTELKSLVNEVKTLKEQDSFLRAIIDCTQDAISIADKQGNGLLINQAYTKLTGFKEKDIIGKPASVDIAEGESMHVKVLTTKTPVYGVPMKVGPHKKEVLVNVAPIIISEQLKGSVAVIHDVSEIRRLTRELDSIKRRLRYLDCKYTFDDVVARSSCMEIAVQKARKAAETSVTIMLRGESGTGKELFAHAIHNASSRSNGKFIRVNCAAIPESLLESELFGYVEGAFTGAKQGGRKGLFEEAKGGTVLLDEIGEMHMNMQSKLLRVIEEKEIIRIGDNKTIPTDVRIIAATNRDLEAAIREKRFRGDLFYRLNVYPILIPSLRDRKEDIPKLIKILIQKYNMEYGRNVKGISDECVKILVGYSWPGNVRELENVIARAIINMDYTDTIIDRDSLPYLEEQSLANNSGYGKDEPAGDYVMADSNLASIMDKHEKQILLDTLRMTRGNKTKAASILGIAIRTLYNKLEQHGLMNNGPTKEA